MPEMTLTDYISRKEGGRGLTSIEDSIAASIQRLEDNKERMITVTRNNTDNLKTNRTTITRKQKYEEIQLYGHF